jgi:hypothetical protein
MPRKPGLPKRKNTTALTWQKTLGLIQPICISTFRFKNDEERREAWRHNKAAIMALQGKPLDIGTDSAALQRSLHRKIWFDYFKRPGAWFEYDRHEVLTGHPPDKRTLFFDADVDQAPKNAVIYEDQKQYLIENNLLNAAEKRILRAEKAKNE